MKCAQIHPNLAAFVVGGLEPEEAAEVEGYLTYCPGCRDEQAKPRS
jgi:anti-sigma factor RsiW